MSLMLSRFDNIVKEFQKLQYNVNDHKINSIFTSKTLQPNNACNLKTHEMVKKYVQIFSWDLARL